jgi:hypothetical protein
MACTVWHEHEIQYHDKTKTSAGWLGRFLDSCAFEQGGGSYGNGLDAINKQMCTREGDSNGCR